jgi:antitoxin ChpS
MHTTVLRKIGESVMIAVPAAMLEALQLRPGAKVGLTVQNGRLVFERWQRPRYTLDELLAQCNPRAHRSEQEREHLADESVGRELI